LIDIQPPVERAFLIGAPRKGSEEIAQVDEHLDELTRLADTAGAEVVGRTYQRVESPSPTFYLGQGKVEELKPVLAGAGATLVMFDEGLSPVQGVNLEKHLGLRVMDRTEVILDIFATRARSHEAKLQVELAQLEYLLPRLTRMWTHLSRIRGGIGLRGPGETQLETDRRAIRRKISILKKRLEGVADHRANQRRGRSGRPSAALVGYTNAGKSSLLKALSGDDVFVEDRLFATLDPRTRRLELPGGEAVLVNDTVGFVRKLPHQLVEAFQSTLEVVKESDLLVHVVDSSAPDPAGQIDAVRTVLAEIGADRVPELLAFNKSDIAPDAKRLVDRHPGSVMLSASTGEGLEHLLRTIGDRLRALAPIVELRVPYDRGDVVAALHREGEVLSEAHEPDATLLRARFRSGGIGRFQEFVVQS